MKKSWNYKFSVMFAIVCIWSSAATGAVIEGVEFNKKLATKEATLDLRGTGLLRYMVFIKAYVGALYLPQDVPSAEVLSDVPKHLVLEYFHSIEGHKFGPATIASLKKNFDTETLDELMPRIEYHNSLYVDVKPGDRYSLTYVPGQGTKLRLNGVERGTIEGADFAAAIFSIWLGAKPMDNKFKRSLLGMR
jgi:Chalcone isomerase-like